MRYLIKKRQSIVTLLALFSFFLIAAVVAPAAKALEQPIDFRWSAYLGYAGVELSEDVVCQGPACNGVLDSSPFYGISGSINYDPFQLQAVISQDQDGDPDLSLAQLSATKILSGWQSTIRGGKIINPLGLFGANRITPTVRPGLEMPQSFFLNSFYDLLSTSEYGGALEFRKDNLVLKGAVFRPEPESIRTVVVNEDNTENGGAIGDINDLTGIDLGLSELPTIGGGTGGGTGGGSTTTTSTDTIEKTSYYVGAQHDNFDRLYDVGFVQLRIGTERINVFTLGGQHRYGRWLPSIELTNMNARKADIRTNGYSATLLYQAKNWAAFANATRFDGEVLDSRDYNVGGVYFYEKWSFKLSIHSLDRAIESNNSELRLLDTESAALAISYRIK